MPLLIICGYPSSGKTHLAAKLHDSLKQMRKSVLVSDENFTSFLERNSVFSDCRKEKELRSFLKSEVERHISQDTVVILDSGNYIKGFRYELYCLSKGVKTTHCVVHCDLLPVDCWKLNEKRQQHLQYNKEIFYSLIRRFEEPHASNRWDSPLIIMRKGDDISPIYTQVEEALFSRKAPPPNLSTQSQPLASTNYLYDLDKTTEKIINAVIDAQGRGIVEDYILIQDATEQVYLPRRVSPRELRMLQRQFLTYIKNHPVSDNSSIPNMFVQYLNKLF